jgi:cytochrome c biogenesis protein CcmG, thiol:disulfide interchange protein DsbE
MDEMTEVNEAPVARAAPRKALILLASIMIVGALAAAGIYLSGQEKAAPIAGEYVKKLGIETPENRTPAPDFTLKDLANRPVSLKHLEGKAVFLNFWATWCVPCRQEMPTMEKLHRELQKEGLEVVAINFRESKAEVQKFVDELGLTFTVLLDTEGTVSEQYGVWSLPLSYFINRKGEFAGKVIGYRNWHGPEAQRFFRDLLDSKL